MNRTIDLRNAKAANHVTKRGSAGSSQHAQQLFDPSSITFITCANDETQYRVCLRHIDALQIPSGYTVEKIVVFGATSMAEGYQRAMEASTARYKIYVHQDVYLIHRGLLPELVDLFRTYPRLGLVGVVGATRLTASGIWWLNNLRHSHGRIWEYSRPSGLPSFLGPLNRRRLHLVRYRSFPGDYRPAAVVDGLFMATQYDVPWTNPLGGFELYDQVQVVEFIKAGLEVGIARQKTVWCLHWGPPREFSPEDERRKVASFHHRAAAFRQLYQPFVRVPARKLYEQHRGASRVADLVASEFGGAVTDKRTAPQGPRSSHSAREHLSVAVVGVNGQEMVLRALRALLPQCEALKDIEYQVVVVDTTSTTSVNEAVRRESAKVTVTASASNGGLAGAFNVGLRDLGFPGYFLVTRDDEEISDGTLARMVSYLREHPSTAGVVASLLNPDGTVLAQRIAFVELMPRRPRRPQPVSFVSTTCALVRGEVFFDVGLYDERLSSCHEALDWSLRARRKGYKFTYLPQARVIHHRRERSRQNGASVFAKRAIANLWLVHKHAGRRWATAFYWAQQLRARWLVFRWRDDSEAVRRISEAMAQATNLYRRFREENQRPELL